MVDSATDPSACSASAEAGSGRGGEKVEEKVGESDSRLPAARVSKYNTSFFVGRLCKMDKPGRGWREVGKGGRGWMRVGEGVLDGDQSTLFILLGSSVGVAR